MQHNAVNNTNNMPVVVLSSVTVPNYLDTTDIITRHNSKLSHVPNSRMSSILSVGIKDYITHILADKNPNIFVTNETQINAPTYQLIVNISRLDIQKNNDKTGNITLEADWSLVPTDDQQPIQKQKGIFTATGSIATASDIIKLEQTILMQLTNHINLRKLH